MITNDQIDKCIGIARRYGAKRLVLFGSAVEDPAHARDIDLICEGVVDTKFFEMAGTLENETRALVDVVPAYPRSRFVEINLKRGRVIYERE